MEIFLETERLLLRPTDESDGLNLHALNSDPEVMKYLSPKIILPPGQEQVVLGP